MATARGHTHKVDLTPEEKVIAAYLYLCCGMPQQHIAAAFRGVNSGRVAEAVDRVRKAVEWPEKESAPGPNA